MEYQYRSNPFNADTDGDTLSDGLEITTHHTSPILTDTDGDGSRDNHELTNGTDPLNRASFWTSLSGNVHYAGPQRGLIRINAVTNPASSSPFRWYEISRPDTYAITALPTLRNYWIEAYRDSNGNAVRDPWEATACPVVNPLYLVSVTSGIDVVLLDPDSDGDGMNDGWELEIVRADPSDGIDSIEDVSPGDDFDQDGCTNGEEADHNLSPIDPAAHLMLLSGNVTYTGRVAGSMRVRLKESSTSGIISEQVVLPHAGPYAMDAVPSGRSLWLAGFIDMNANDAVDSWEPQGAFPVNPLILHADRQGVDFALSDPDRDLDTLPDWWEVTFFGTTLDVLDCGDPDGDGLRNSLEYAYDTNPILADTDGDGATDSVESRFGSDPNSTLSRLVTVTGAVQYAGESVGPVRVMAATQSSVWDGPVAVVDMERPVFGLFPLMTQQTRWFRAFMDVNDNDQPDSWEPVADWGGNPVAIEDEGTVILLTLSDPDLDSDGLPDPWEMSYFGTLTQDPSGDFDSDGTSNQAEFESRLNPTNRLSFLAAVSGLVSYSGLQEGVIRLCIVATDGSPVPVASTNLAAPGLFALAPLTVPANYRLSVWVDANGNRTNDFWEAACTSFPDTVSITGNLSGVSIALVDPDSDRDGLPDWWEVRWVDARTDDAITGVEHFMALADFDGDGASNVDEFLAGTDPEQASDQPATVSFVVALSYGLEPPAQVPEGSNMAVRVVLSRPLSFGCQVTARLEPVNTVAGADYVAPATQVLMFPAGMLTGSVVLAVMPDSTRETNECLRIRLENPSPGIRVVGPAHVFWIGESVVDSDGDGLPDDWERVHFGALPVSDGTGNADGDGWTDREEFMTGGDPRLAGMPDDAGLLGLSVLTPLK
jgi:hypothetical protein